jgi:hypothetical protein
MKQIVASVIADSNTKHAILIRLCLLARFCIKCYSLCYRRKAHLPHVKPKCMVAHSSRNMCGDADESATRNPVKLRMGIAVCSAIFNAMMNIFLRNIHNCAHALVPLEFIHQKTHF